MRLLILLLLGCLITTAVVGQTTFSEQATAWGINTSGIKDGGHSFADYDGDGDLDLLVNTDSDTELSRLYRNNGNNTFTDVTSTLAPALLVNKRERAAVWGDLNNDGRLDFIRNTGSGGAQKIEVYIQASNGLFGNGIGGTTPIYIGQGGGDDVYISDGLNSEGAGMLDFDGDGDLDIIFDNHDFGIDVLRNNYINHNTNAVVNPSAANLFSHATPGTTPILGLAQSAIDGDYGSFTDVNDDGWVDIFMRKQNENDFFLNQGGTFINDADLAEAQNYNKGAVALYDFDNDGDFDAYWTENGDNQIFRNDGAGVWTPLGTSTGISNFNGIDDVACGDIDNDGDIDIVLVGQNRSYLYINNLNSPTGGVGAGSPMSFSFDNSQSFHSGQNGEGTTMVDIDEDGDLDIYFNIRNGNNQLWINNLYTNTTHDTLKTYLFVEVLEDRSFMQTNKERPALGATVVLLDCNDNVLSGIREVNGGGGHGTQIPNRVHFGLPWGSNYNYKVLVKYPNYRNGGATTRKEVIRWLNPSEETNFPVSVTVRATDSDTDCPPKLEICDNGLDDDGDGKTDCADTGDCKPIISNVTFTQPTCPSGNDGTITVVAALPNNTGTLQYRLIGVTGWQNSNTFTHLSDGIYTVRVRIQETICGINWSSNIQLDVPICDEVCNDGQDNDGDGLIDCADSDCKPILTNVAIIQPTCTNKTGGQIVITASSSSAIQYSITNEPNWQNSNTFSNLGVGQYIIRVRNASGCTTEYSTNPVVLDFGTCIEICDNGIDDDGDGKIDCNDPDCEKVGTTSTINNN